MRKLSVRLALAAALLAGLGVVSIPAHAATGGTPITCTLAGSTTIVKNATNYSWSTHGIGSCINPGATQFAELDVAGTSDSLGLCDGPSGVLSNLDLTAVLKMTNTVTNNTRVITFKFTNPLTVYPAATPFQITHDGSSAGAGTLFNHIFLACPPAGTPSTQITLAVLL
ncbi:MAG: hypothetical protein QOF21_2391 [Actinomycetota bacterium]|jgi:hypothetical protein